MFETLFWKFVFFLAFSKLFLTFFLILASWAYIYMYMKRFWIWHSFVLAERADSACLYGTQGMKDPWAIGFITQRWWACFIFKFLLPLDTSCLETTKITPLTSRNSNCSPIYFLFQCYLNVISDWQFLINKVNTISSL